MTISEDSARQNLQALLKKYNDMSEEARRKLSEDDVVHHFINILLRDVLGWPTEDPARYKYELHTQAGRPDITLLPESGGTIFVEAKKFGIIKGLEQARFTLAGTITPGQMALPGMSVDRTPEEQQAINYAFDNGGTWAILTNFEKLRLFNARRDWLVLSFENPDAYQRDFDLLWQLAYPNLLNGSLDSLSSQRHTEEVDTVYLEFINEWREKLARDIMQRPDLNAWVRRDDGQVDLPLLRAVVQRFLDRLVIIRFAEDHLVIPPGTLRELYDVRQKNPYTFTMDEFLDRFFRQFDEQHNSALFAYGPVDQASFSDDVLLPLVSKLYEARYRAMPADILGNTYEQYLGKALVIDNGAVKTRDNLETRKKQGSYYTPQVIVRYIVDNSLGRYLYATQNGRPDGQPVTGETRKTAAGIIDLRVLDSACGSGSFLIYAYYVLDEFYRLELARLEREAEARRRELVAGGMTSPIDLQIELTPYTAQHERIREYPRLILENHLYGVDLDPQAAEIAVVNLMMRAMEGRHREKRLPLILNQNVKVGNSLIGLRPDDPRLDAHRDALARIRHLRADLIRAPQGTEHDRIVSDLESATRDLNRAFEADFGARFSDLERVHPFHWGVEFPEVFYNEAGALKDQPGFTIIFGNPPYGAEVSTKLVEYYSQNFITASANDNYALFIERSVQLLAVSGCMGMIVPSGWVSMSGMRLLRDLFIQRLTPRTFATMPYDIFADAYVDTVITIASKQDIGTSWEQVSNSSVDLVVFPAKYKLNDIADYDKFRKTSNPTKWLVNPDKQFFITLSEDQLRLVEKIRISTNSLGHISIIKRGIEVFKPTKLSHSGSSLLAFTGSVRRYRISNGEQAYIEYGDAIRNSKPLELFSGPRILLRQLISRQFQLQAMYTEETFATNQSMQSIVLADDRYHPFYVLALINSRFMSWYFLSTYSVARRDDYPKVILEQTRSLPFREINFDDNDDLDKYNRLIELVGQMIKLNQDIGVGDDFGQRDLIQEQIRELDKMIDMLVYILLGLDPSEIDMIENTTW